MNIDLIIEALMKAANYVFDAGGCIPEIDKALEEALAFKAEVEEYGDITTCYWNWIEGEERYQSSCYGTYTDKADRCPGCNRRVEV